MSYLPVMSVSCPSDHDHRHRHHHSPLACSVAATQPKPGLIEPFGISSIRRLGEWKQQNSRTRRLARSVRRVACDDSGGSRGTERRAPRKARGGVAGHDDGGAASLTDAVADGTCGGRGSEDEEDGSGELHGEVAERLGCVSLDEGRVWVRDGLELMWNWV
jgi:hypothetical protein